MFAYHKQSLPPSGSSFATACRITPSCLRANHYSQAHLNKPVTHNLIVGRGNFIQIFEVYQDKGQQNSHASNDNSSNSSSSAPYRLSHVVEHTLQGVITGISAIKTLETAEDGLDRVLVSFKDAKMSLLEWSQDLYDLVPVSLHTYERLPQVSQGDLTGYTSRLRTDPANRCSALLLPQNCFAILQIFQEQIDLEGFDTKGLASLPYAPSFVLELANISSDVKSILDFAFLPGYNEPTMAILYRKVQTWTGRLEIDEDNVELIIITLDLTPNHFPIIFKSAALPYDCFSVHPCPIELGGVLIMSANSIIHLDQASKVVVIPTNGWASEVTSLKPQTEAPVPIIHDSYHLVTSSDSNGLAKQLPKPTPQRACLGMESSFPIFLTSDLAFIVHNSGTIYGLHISRDGRSISKMSLTRMGLGPIPSVLERISDDSFYIGSMVTDGALVRVVPHEISHEKSQNVEVDSNNLDEDDDEVVEEQKQEQNGEKEEEGDDDDDDEDDIYKTTTPAKRSSSSQLTQDPRSKRAKVQANTNRGPEKTCILQLDDEIPAYGPIRDLCMGTVATNAPPELVATTGLEPFGGFTIFYRAINPCHQKVIDDLYNDFSEHWDNVWSLRTIQDHDVDINTISHNTLVLSSSENTAVYHINNSSSEMYCDLFLEVNEKALGAYELPNLKSILLVTQTTIKLLKSDVSHKTDEWLQTLDEIPLPKIFTENTTVQFSAPYLLILQQDEAIAIVHVDSNSFKLSNVELPNEIDSLSLSSASVYTDYGYDLPIKLSKSESETNTKSAEQAEKDEADTKKTKENGNGEEPTNKEANNDKNNGNEMDIDDDVDDNIYTDNKADGTSTEQSNDHFGNVTLALSKSDSFSSWLFLITSNSTLLIYSLPDFELHFKGLQLNVQPRALFDFTLNDPQDSQDSASSQSQNNSPKITELVCSPIGSVKRPGFYLSFLIDGNTLCSYKAVPEFSVFDEHDDDPDAMEKDYSDNIRQKFLGVKFVKSFSKALGAQRRRKDAHGNYINSAKRTLKPFEHVREMSGIFLTGDSPSILMSSGKGALRRFEFGVRDVTCFVPFKTFIGEESFLYLSAHGKVTMADLPGAVYDGELPWCKVGEERTYVGLAYDAASSMFVSASLFNPPFALFDDDGNLTWAPETNDLLVPQNFRSAIELIIPGSWETINGYEFRQNEVVMALKSVRLESKSTSTGLRDFIAVGTTLSRGEDLGVRGAVYVFEVIETVPTPEAPEASRSLRLLFMEDLKGAVSAVCEIDGYLAHSMGQKVFIKAFEHDERLISVGFLDVGVHTISLKAVKNYLMIGDALRGVSLAAFQEDPYKVVLLGKEYRFTKVDAMEFMTHERRLALLGVDEDGVLRMHEYNPQGVETMGGQRLLCHTEFQLGCNASCAITFAKRNTSDALPRQNGVIFGGIDGSLTCIMPVREAVYKRLQTLERQIIRNVQPSLGLNPRAFRTVRNDSVSRPLTRGILDGDLLSHFADPVTSRQETMTKKIRTDVATIEANLRTLKAPW